MWSKAGEGNTQHMDPRKIKKQKQKKNKNKGKKGQWKGACWGAGGDITGSDILYTHDVLYK